MGKTVQRNRAKLDLTITNIEIETKNYNFLKAAAAANNLPMSSYIDRLIEKRRAKYEASYKAADSSLKTT